jgi:hypothetical protein
MSQGGVEGTGRCEKIDFQLLRELGAGKSALGCAELFV